ncbi:MAG TPA: DUF4197 domain-containing protein [Candidatus Omnitrophota bacterium]|nr:DUF4197 domain-containing protein [Candidatus Omnitrophota bacterium]
MMKKIILLAALFLIPASAQALDWAGMLKKVSTSQPATGDSKIANGLKEALRVGAEKAVAITGKQDGYFKNEAIKILLPERLRAMEGALRKVGLGGQIDQLVLSMNRAAEAAAPQAKSIFVKAISEMTFDDVQKIYQGGDTAATQYFQTKTSPELTRLFKPAVTQSMAEYNVSKMYQGVAGKYNALPAAKLFPAPEVEDYVVKQSLSGLFKVLGDQEKAIRKDPAARVTQLLKDVFSQAK